MAAQVQTYTVKGGDNLFSIAANIYKNPRMFAEIMRLNNLTSGVIRPGMVLKLPRNRPDFAINITSGLMAGIKAENDFLQQYGRLPTQTELSNFVANGGTTPTLFGGVSGTGGLSQEQYQMRYRTATGTPDGIKFAMPAQNQYVTPTVKTPTTSMVDPNAPITIQEFNRRKAQEAITGYEQANKKPTYYEQTYGEAPVPPKPTYPGISQMSSKFAQARQIVSEAVQQLVNPATGQLLYPDGIQKPPLGSEILTSPLGSEILTQKPELQYYNPLQKTTFNTVTPNVAKSTLQEQQLPDPTVDTNMNVAALQASGMNQDQANLYIRVLSSQNPTADDIYQFKYVFNITDTSELGKLLGSKLVVVPPTNDQTMTNIWDELQKTGGYNMPTEWIINQRRGGGGRGGAGGGGSSTYFGGNSATYGGF